MEEVFDRVHPEDRDQVRAAVIKAEKPLDSGKFATEHRIVTGDGGEQWISVQGTYHFAQRGEGRAPARGVGIVSDIGSRKGDERFRRVLMRELKHRVKNTHAIIQAISRQTARSVDTLDDYDQVFGGRLQAITSADGIITENVESGVEFKAMIAAQLRPLLGPEMQPLTQSGPDLRLGGATAQVLGLVLHELATNAMKYGALLQPGVTVATTWDRLHAAQEDSFAFNWQETGGPEVTASAAHGFGSRLIEMSIGQLNSGSCEVNYDPDGARVRLTLPVDGQG